MTGFEFFLLLERGRRAGVSVAAGIICGSATWGIAAALGMSALMLANAWLVEILRYVGAAYLIFLASKAARSAWVDKPLTTVKANDGGMHAFFGKGLALHLTNPKAIFGWGAVFAIAVPPGSAPIVVAESFLALFAVSNFIFFGYAFLFSTGHFVRKYQKLRRWFELGFATMFGLAGFKILTARIAP